MTPYFRNALLLLVVGCSGGDGTQPVIEPEPDASVATPDSATLDVVTVVTFGDQPVFIKYRNGDGPWQTPTESSDGYELLVTDRYELVTVCGSDELGFDVGIEA